MLGNIRKLGELIKTNPDKGLVDFAMTYQRFNVTKGATCGILLKGQGVDLTLVFSVTRPLTLVDYRFEASSKMGDRSVSDQLLEMIDKFPQGVE